LIAEILGNIQWMGLSVTRSNGIIHTMPFWDERFQAIAAQPSTAICSCPSAVRSVPTMNLPERP